jgi:hypothetical protein
MATNNTKLINTRIKNKVDTLSNWNSATGTLLNGEIAIVRVPTGGTYVNPVTNKSEPEIELLMKVGDGSKTFAQLPWLSAKASDVYNWAKGSTAEGVELTISTGENSTSKQSLATWIKTFYDNDAAHDATLEAHGKALKDLIGDDTTGGSIADAIKAAIDKLDHIDESKAANTIVKAVAQTDGKVTVTYGSITEAELPDISASKIKVDANTTLTTKLGAMDADIEAVEAKLDGVTKVTTSISDAINALDVNEPTASGTSTSFIATAKQEDGKIVVTKKNLPTASDSVAGITTLGVSGGAATHDAVFGTNGLSSKVEKNTSDIEGIKVAIAGGVHFRGTVTAEPSATTTKVGDFTIAAGDVVIYSGKEYICTAVVEGKPSWEQLGDVTRIGALETKIDNLDYSNTTDSGANKFVTNVTQTDGKIAVTFARPTSADVSHSTSTVKATLENHDSRIEAVEEKLADVTDTVGASITAALDNLDFTDPTTGGNTSDYQFIATVSQENGQISATKKTIPDASTTVKGVVKLNNTLTSTSTTEAATANAVKTVQGNIDSVDERVEAVEDNYVKFVPKSTSDTTQGKLCVGKTGTDVIIFDCGGASDL